MKRKSNENVVVLEFGAANRADVFICGICFYIPQYTTDVPQQTWLRKHVNARSLTQLSNNGSCVSVSNVEAQKMCFFDLGITGGNDLVEIFL